MAIKVQVSWFLSLPNIKVNLRFRNFVRHVIKIHIRNRIEQQNLTGFFKRINSPF
jgi:hypothetical protein